MSIGIILDACGFVFILLSLIYSIKIYRMVKLRDFIWLILATGYGLILRGLHLARNFGIPVPSSSTISHLFSIFYVLLFLGIMAYYNPIKEMWNSARSETKD